jgi:hypothetical protein
MVRNFCAVEKEISLLPIQAATIGPWLNEGNNDCNLTL